MLFYASPALRFLGVWLILTVLLNDEERTKLRHHAM